MSNKKNPTAGNVNERPAKDPGTGQVLDHTDNKGGHLDQVENIPGSDTIKEVGPASNPVEANSNVEKDARFQVTADSQGANRASEQSVDAQLSSEARQSASSETVESTPGKQVTDPQGGNATADATAPKADSAPANAASEGADAKDTPVHASTAKSSPKGANDAQGKHEKQPEGEPEPDKAAEDQTMTVGTKEAEYLSDADLRALYKNKLPDDTLNSWDHHTLLLYHQKRVMPSRTLRGNWPNDIRRERGMVNWQSDELLDWLDGHIAKPRAISEEDLWDEIFKRFRIPGNWSNEQAKTYIQTGERPEYTKSGVLVDDQSRELKAINDWTHNEIRSALLGEIQSKFSQEELLEQLRLRLNLSTNYSGARLLENLPDSPTEANVDNTVLKSKLDEYKEIMSKNGGNLTAQTAGIAQSMLYKAIRSVMAREPQDFHEGFNIILDFINENYSTLFVDEKARRGWSHLSGMSKSATSTFEDMLTLMIHTRKPGNRAAAAKLYSLDQVLRHVTSEQERSNVIMYYGAQ